MSPKRLPSPPTRSVLRLHSLRRRLSLSLSISTIASSSPTAPTRIVKLKFGLDPSRILSIFRSHIRSMYLYLMPLEIQLRIKHDKLLRLTHRMRTREMRLRKMQLLEGGGHAHTYVKTPNQSRPKSTYKAFVILKARDGGRQHAQTDKKRASSTYY